MVNIKVVTTGLRRKPEFELWKMYVIALFSFISFWIVSLIHSSYQRGQKSPDAWKLLPDQDGIHCVRSGCWQARPRLTFDPLLASAMAVPICLSCPVKVKFFVSLHLVALFRILSHVSECPRANLGFCYANFVLTRQSWTLVICHRSSLLVSKSDRQTRGPTTRFGPEFDMLRFKE